MKRRFSWTGEYVSFVWGMSLVLLCLASVAAGGTDKPATRAGMRRTKPASMSPIQLPTPQTSSQVSFEQAVIEQRKVQMPGDQRLDMAKIGQLAWATQGATAPSVNTTLPPAQSQIVGEPSIRAYFILPDGLFSYEPMSHTLQPINDKDCRATAAAAMLRQAVVPVGGCQIILAASTRDFSSRYGTRARTVMALQTGKIAQNIQLQAATLGLSLVSIDAVEAADLRTVTRIPRGFDPLYAAIIGYPAGLAPTTAVQPTVTTQSSGRALLVVPPIGFQDEELFATKRTLELAGVQTAIASARMGPLAGMLGGTAQANMLLNQASVDNYDAVVFIGGTGALDYQNNPTAQNLARQASVRGKILAAIGTAPSILATAGVMRGVRSTAYLSERERMVRAGAVYTGNPAEKDGNIITATGPLAVSLFTQAIIESLGGETQ
ncbi:MAG: DJ-1/PfpI family protein [Phycisphaerae bacterium]|nr:DJ-1/PfpI family protein [Phycisphaerae bacterium]